jgi:hypothetical protein
MNRFSVLRDPMGGGKWEVWDVVTITRMAGRTRRVAAQRIADKLNADATLLLEAIK